MIKTYLLIKKITQSDTEVSHVGLNFAERIFFFSFSGLNYGGASLDIEHERKDS